MTDHERFGKALEPLQASLVPFVEREVQADIRASAVNMETVRRFAKDPLPAKNPIGQWDSAGSLQLMWAT